MRFVVDGMLGKLTRWLRMLGHDVEYSSKLDDAQLLTVARSEKRILLTRDLELYQQATSKGIESFYLAGDSESGRLAELKKRYDIRLEIDMVTSRCPKCNNQVQPVSKDEVENLVKGNTSANYTDFWRCPQCGQVYWQGAHWTKIKKTLEAARMISETPSSGKS